MLHEIYEKGAGLQILEPAIDTSGPMGTMVLTVLGMVSEMELGVIRESQHAGIEAAKERGVYKDRKQNLDDDEVMELKKSGMGATAIACELGCHRTMVYYVLKSA